MAHATSAPSGSPHRGSRKFTATALCRLLASREHQGPAALTGPKSGLEARLRTPTLESPTTRRFKEVHMLPFISGQSLFLFSARIHPIPSMEW